MPTCLGSTLRPFAGLALLAPLAVVAACGGPQRVSGPVLVFPVPPGKPRIQYLTSLRGAEQVEEGRSFFQEFLLGSAVPNAKEINKPYGAAVHDGALYVCDSKDLCLTRMDFRNKEYALIGNTGSVRMKKPINISIDPLGYKFAADPFLKQVLVFAPDDRIVSTYDIPEPCRPVDLAIFGDELYVLDNDKTPQILVLNRRNGEVLRTFGSAGTGPGQLHTPNSICIGPDGYVYISDTLNFRIQKLTREGEPVWVRGGPGAQVGAFTRPRGLRIGPDGILYVVDGAMEIVQMWNSEGEVLMHFGGPGNEPGSMVLPSSVAIDRTTLPFFERYLHPQFRAEYLIFVANQYGENPIGVYAFGSFPDGYELPTQQIRELPPIEPEDEPGVEGIPTLPESAPASRPGG